MEGNQKIRPLFSNVIVKKDDSEEKSKTGIIIGTDENPALVGIVVSVGKDLTEEIKPGNKIMYAPFSGRELGGFLILAEHDIMGVIEEDEYVDPETCEHEVDGNGICIKCKKDFLKK